MPGQSTAITIPNVKLSLEELLAVIRQLDGPARAEVARVLAETKMDAELSRLIEELAESPPIEDIPDDQICAEVKIVRQGKRIAADAKDRNRHGYLDTDAPGRSRGDSRFESLASPRIRSRCESAATG
ncbi:MAG TPA: hypothetical protein VMY42_27810 [Thermoguttaceae bacterium]|nr:hypothetical protein [Thermoguttaceae bacterium]